MATTYELAARQKKVAAILEVLKIANVSAEIMRGADEHDWQLLEQAAKVNPTSADTRNVVIKQLAENEENGR